MAVLIELSKAISVDYDSVLEPFHEYLVFLHMALIREHIRSSKVGVRLRASAELLDKLGNLVVLLGVIIFQTNDMVRVEVI